MAASDLADLYDLSPRRSYRLVGIERAEMRRASRLAGQRALRIRASDLVSVLEPVEPGEI